MLPHLFRKLICCTGCTFLFTYVVADLAQSVSVAFRFIGAEPEFKHRRGGAMVSVKI